MRRILAILLFLTALAGPESRPAEAARAGNGQEALKRLTAEFEALDANPARGSRRDLWLGLEEKFDRLAKTGKGDTQAWAVYYHARSRQELGRRSYLASDHREAVSRFAGMASRFPRHEAAPESLYRQADILVHRLGDRQKAIPVLEKLLKDYPSAACGAGAKKLLEQARSGKGKEQKSAGTPPPSTAKPSITLKTITWQEKGQRALVTLELDASTKFSHRFLPPDPARKVPGRLYLDLLGALPGSGIQSGLSPKTMLVSRIRTGQTEKGTRVTLECDDLQCYLVSSPKGSPQIIQIEVSRKQDIKGGIPVKGVAAGGPASPGREKPGSVMEQLGLTVQTIMIDPGHGGNDPGARAGGIVEKQFTLQMAKRIGALLQKEGFTVLYTRTTDRYISLQERPDLANSKKADLFLSIHVNANPKTGIRGLETYYLDEAKTQDAATVAARENGVSVKNISDLQFILTDLMLSSKVKESHHLADCVHTGILKSLREAKVAAPDNGVRSAPFYVLVGARMPAILVEFGYITNKADLGNLKNEAYLQRQAEGVVKGVLRYRAELAKTLPNP